MSGELAKQRQDSRGPLAAERTTGDVSRYEILAAVVPYEAPRPLDKIAPDLLVRRTQRISHAGRAVEQ